MSAKLTAADRDSVPLDLMTIEATKAKPRFWARVRRTPGCWLWIGARRNGYGILWIANHVVYAHRLSFVIYNGPIEPDLVICHHCDVPLCVRPCHLFKGTRADNNADMRAKGRARCVAPSGESHPKARISDRVAVDIRREYVAGNANQYELARRYGVGQSCIWQIVHQLGRFGATR